jgi:hypothetical protein
MNLVRAVLLAPEAVARMAGLVAGSAEERWMLGQPRDVRRSFVENVVDRPGDPHAQERWMLLQPDAVRKSYVREVLDTAQ